MGGWCGAAPRPGPRAGARAEGAAGREAGGRGGSGANLRWADGAGRNRDLDLARAGAGWLRTLLREAKLRGKGTETTAAEQTEELRVGREGWWTETQLLRLTTSARSRRAGSRL